MPFIFETIEYHYFPGLFLHIGYSVSDRYLLEANSDLQFNFAQITDKLTALLNGDSSDRVSNLLWLPASDIEAESMYLMEESDPYFRIIIDLTENVLDHASHASAAACKGNFTLVVVFPPNLC